MDSPALIGLSGKMGAGKTTVADRLLACVPRARRLSFGDRLKAEAASLFSFPVEWCYSGKHRRLPVTMGRYALGMPHDMTIRELLQWYGTEVGRARNPGRWIEAVKQSMNGLKADLIVIDDVRFPNEADFIREHGGLLARLHPFTGGAERDKGALHESETALDGYPHWDVVYRPAFGEADAVADSLLAYFRKRATKEGTNPGKFTHSAGGAA